MYTLWLSQNLPPRFYIFSHCKSVFSGSVELVERLNSRLIYYGEVLRSHIIIEYGSGAVKGCERLREAEMG